MTIAFRIAGVVLGAMLHMVVGVLSIVLGGKVRK